MSEPVVFPEEFLQKEESFGLVGASSSWSDHAYYLFLELEKKGYTITPFHSKENVVCGVPAFSEFLYTPEIQRIIFATKEEDTALEYLRKMRDVGISKAWFEEGFSTPAMEEFAKQNFFEVVKEINLLETLRAL